MFSPLMYSARKLTRVYRNLLITHFHYTQEGQTFRFIPLSLVVSNFPLSHEQFLFMEQSKVFNHKGNVKVNVYAMFVYIMVPFILCRY